MNWWGLCYQLINMSPEEDHYVCAAKEGPSREWPPRSRAEDPRSYLAGVSQGDTPTPAWYPARRLSLRLSALRLAHSPKVEADRLPIHFMRKDESLPGFKMFWSRFGTLTTER